MKIKEILAISAIVVLGCTETNAAWSQVQEQGAATILTVPYQSSNFLTDASRVAGGIDYQNAQPMPLPASEAAVPRSAAAGTENLSQSQGPSGLESGDPGSGVRHAVQLLAPRDIPASEIGTEDWGTGGVDGVNQQPFTTARVNALNDLTVNYYPYRAAGKLFFLEGSSSFVCSASLIKPGVVVTAGHCVANYGLSQFYSGWQFVPAYNNGSAPYGLWTAKSATVLTSYFKGTDGCFQSGVICPDDVAVITLNAQSGKYAGASTGYFGYAYGSAGFNSSSQTLITQLGYPCDLDACLLMQRNDSQGFLYPTYSGDIIIGSLMTGGSSGGPWVVNIGTAPVLSGGDTTGGYGSYNVIVGVTGWGYTNLGVKQMGASHFTSTNIVALLSTACSATPAAC
jgi:V8-like Glu-specific endopeptidase